MARPTAEQVAGLEVGEGALVLRAHQRERERLQDGALAHAVLAEQHRPAGPVAVAQAELELQPVDPAEVDDVDRSDVLRLERLAVDVLRDGGAPQVLFVRLLVDEDVLLRAPRRAVVAVELALQGDVRASLVDVAAVVQGERGLPPRLDERRPVQPEDVDRERSAVEAVLVGRARARDEPFVVEDQVLVRVVGAGIQQQGALSREIVLGHLRARAADREAVALVAIADLTRQVEVLPRIGEPPVAGTGRRAVQVDRHGPRTERLGLRDVHGADSALAVGAPGGEQLREQGADLAQQCGVIARLDAVADLRVQALAAVRGPGEPVVVRRAEARAVDVDHARPRSRRIENRLWLSRRAARAAASSIHSGCGGTAWAGSAGSRCGAFSRTRCSATQ